MKKIVLILMFLSPSLWAQNNASENDEFIRYDNAVTYYPIKENETFYYKKPGPFQHFANAPGDIWTYTQNSFQQDNWISIGGIALMTAMLVVVDQDIVDEAQRFGRRIGISGKNKVKAATHILGYPMQVPMDFSSSLYFIGDGWTHTSITVSFLTYGLIDNDARALQTASQLAEGLLTVTFVTQLLKHITGRQSPYKATQSGGKWRLFPNQVKYHKNVPAYDAYPSGHLASATMMLTVIAENYKEYKFIKPLGYTLLTILSFQMLNNGVHWASDYPLAIAIGYSLGQLAVGRGRNVLKNGNEVEMGIRMINPHTLGLSYSLLF